MVKLLVRGVYWAAAVALLFAVQTGQASAWQVSADFESGSLGSLAQGSSGFDESNSMTTFSSERAHSGRQSAKMSWPYNARGSVAGGGFYFPSYVGAGGEIWSRGYYYFASPWTWSAATSEECGCAIKTNRIHIRSASGTHVGYDGIISNSYGSPYVNCETCGTGLNVYQNVGGSINLEPDRWYAVEVYVKAHPTDGVVRMWIDGQLKVEQRGLQTLSSGSDAMDYTWFMGYWNGGCGQSQVMYMDDLVVTTEPPSVRDASGNPMIGTGGAPATPAATADQTIPAPPTNLRVQ
jgi:hypothetical protein